VLCLVAAPAAASIAIPSDTVTSDGLAVETTTLQSTGAFGPDDWPTYQYDGARTGHHPTATAPQGNVAVAWNATGGRTYSRPVVYDGTVDVTNGTGMQAYDAATGQQRWGTPMDTDAYDHFDGVSPVVLGDRVFAVAGTSVTDALAWVVLGTFVPLIVFALTSGFEPTAHITTVEFVLSILPGVTAYNFHRMSTEKRIIDALWSLTMVLFLTVVGIGLVIAVGLSPLAGYLPPVLLGAESHIANAFGLEISRSSVPILTSRVE
jgi:hypothetical protein